MLATNRAELACRDDGGIGTHFLPKLQALRHQYEVLCLLQTTELVGRVHGPSRYVVLT